MPLTVNMPGSADGVPEELPAHAILPNAWGLNVGSATALVRGDYQPALDLLYQSVAVWWFGYLRQVC